MNYWYIRHLSALFCVLLLAGSTGIAQSAELGEILEVKATSDFRRVIIKCEGEVGPPAAYELAEPSRLVIDFHARLGKMEAKTVFRGQPIREIRAGKLPKGSRLVVDFGENRVPQYQIRQIDNYFVVFLSDAPLQSAASEAAAAAPSTPVWEPTSFPAVAASEPAATDTSGLVIKSAKVIKGMIVLEVEDRNGKPKSYRVDIGVDFDQMGFHTAAVRRIKGVAKQHSAPSKKIAYRGPAHCPGSSNRVRSSEPRQSPQYDERETAPCLVSGITNPQQAAW